MKPYFKQLTINFVVLLSLFTGMHTHCMLNNIKDTDSILHDDYQYLSLINGAIAWETGVIRRLYDFGQIFPVYKEDKQGRKIIENYAHPEQSSKLVRLIHALFYRVPGSTGEADFGVTMQLAVDDLAAVKLTAEIIVQCEQLQQQRSQFLNALNYVQNLIVMIANAGWLTKLDKKTTQAGLEKKIKDVQEKPWNANAAKAFESMCKSFAKNLAKELSEKIVNELEGNQQVADKFFKLITGVTNNLRKLLKSEVFKKRENVESFILEALNESDPHNPAALYPSHTVEMVLLAFVYKKYSHDRMVLKAFYDALNTQFGGKILLHELHVAWVQDSFVSVTQAQALKQIETIFSAQDLMQSIKQHYAEFVYDAFQIRAFPAPVGYATVSYEYEKGKKTVGFADCMDNTMRNFINLYAYDAEQNKFALEKLLATMGIANVHSGLANFLKIFTDTNMASSPEAHNAWLKVISKIPYVAYNQMIDGASGQSTKALDIGKGYIAIPENELNENLLGWLKNIGYQVLEKNQYGYELQPSVKNIIIVLDHLLQLNLFGEASGLSKEFMRPDFIKEYFPKLCAALKATGFLSTQEDAHQGEVDKDFDALDYTASKIYATINLASIVCQFTTYSGHGELQLVQAVGSSEEPQLRVLLHKLSDFTEQTSLSFLVTNALCKQRINFDHLKSNLNCLYINFFATPLENTGLLEDIITQTFSMVNADTPFKIKIGIKDLLLRVAERQPDAALRQVEKLKILTLFVGKLTENDLINCANVFKEVAQVAEKLIFNHNYAVRLLALNLFRALFKKGQGFSEAIAAATKGITDQEKGVRNSALNLFRALFGKGQGFSKAVTAAAKGITDQGQDMRMYALELFKALVQKDQAFAEAMRAAAKEINSVIGSLRERAVDLFKQLMIKVPDKTKAAIQDLMDNPNMILTDDVRRDLDKLLNKK